MKYFLFFAAGMLFSRTLDGSNPNAVRAFMLLLSVIGALAFLWGAGLI